MVPQKALKGVSHQISAKNVNVCKNLKEPSKLEEKTV
jgi:hypothetical protein